ncbi:hypothetical protein OROGR_027359 [Orobanche gracilis]
MRLLLKLLGLVMAMGDCKILPTNDDKKLMDKLKIRSSVQSILKETFVVTNAHIVFQAMVFGVAYMIDDYSKSRCHFGWIPFSLSILAGYIVMAVLSAMTWRFKRPLDLIYQIKAKSLIAAPPQSPQMLIRSLEPVTNEINSLHIREVEIEHAAVSLSAQAVLRMVDAVQENPDLEDQNHSRNRLSPQKPEMRERIDYMCMCV